MGGFTAGVAVGITAVILDAHMIADEKIIRQIRGGRVGAGAFGEVFQGVEDGKTGPAAHKIPALISGGRR